MKSKPPRDCPCCSGRRYTDCCAPLHRRAREAETPEELMRSRFSAFALGLGEHLARTIAKGHADAGVDPPVLAARLARARDTQRFLALEIWHASETGDVSEVLFFARIFERGRDISFAELSTFRKQDGAWRYESGVALPRAVLGREHIDAPLTRDAFLALAGRLAP